MRSFSIVSPIYAYNEQKAQELSRCIESIKNQSYPLSLVEHIIVNDGSIVPVSIPAYRWLRVVNQPNMQRIIAYEKGFSQVKNQVIWCVDADDELVPDALKTVNKYYEKYPKYQMFNFGCSYVHKDGNITTRDSFKPKRKKVGHEIFGGGNIVNGTFVFSKRIYEEMGGFPSEEIKEIDCTSLNYPAGGSFIRDLTMGSPYDFSAWFQLTFPETQQYFMVNVDSEPGKVIKEIGNPFGQDYALFYKYTRKYHSRPMEDRLLTVHIR